MFDLKLIQQELEREGADGWLLVDPSLGFSTRDL